MGFSNGNLTSKAVKVQKGDRGKPGEGFSLKWYYDENVSY